VAIYSIEELQGMKGMTDAAATKWVMDLIKFQAA
jgi:hypothetical protein